MQVPPPPGSNDPRLQNLMQLLSTYNNGQANPPPPGHNGPQTYHHAQPPAPPQQAQQHNMHYQQVSNPQVLHQSPAFAQQSLHQPNIYYTPQIRDVNHTAPAPMQTSQAPSYEQMTPRLGIQSHNQQPADLHTLPPALIEALIRHLGPTTNAPAHPPPPPVSAYPPHPQSPISNFIPLPPSLPEEDLSVLRPMNVSNSNADGRSKNGEQEQLKSENLPNGDHIEAPRKVVERIETLSGDYELLQSSDDEAKQFAAPDSRRSRRQRRATSVAKPDGVGVPLHEEAQDLPPQPERRVQVVMNRWNDDASKWEDVQVPVEKTKPGGFSPSASFRKHMDPDNDKRSVSEELEVHSTGLKTLLKTVSPWWRDIPTDPEPALFILEPFYELVWRWESYVAACKPEPTDTDIVKLAREDLKDVLDVVKTSSVLKSYFRFRDTINTTQKIKFEHLWAIFPHGTKVVTKSYMDELQFFEVENLADYYEVRNGTRRFRVACRAFDWDGNNFSTLSYDFHINHYSGEIPINNLATYPSRYHSSTEGEAELQQRMIARGRKYVSLCTQEPGALQCEYQGTAFVVPTAQHRLTSKGRRRDQLNESTQSVSDDYMEFVSMDITGPKSRVIIDNLAFMKSERNTLKRGDTAPLGRKESFAEKGCVCGHCRSSVIQAWRDVSTTGLTLDELGRTFMKDDERLLYLPPRLLGYALNDRVWGQFLVNKLNHISSVVGDDVKRGPFWDELELEDEHKDHLWAFVTHHRASTPYSKVFDIIEGKGQGLVILLHGPPGVGKTLTAETIAIATGRPLLAVSVAEIGVDYKEAEHNLTEIFADAARWEAVLLMDEADVFVEQRTTQADMGRNALVSVMLRCLEYFEGIIIMTTNRVKSIDAAVQSRIQLAIQYHDLSEEQRVAIYTNRLKHIPEEEFEDRKQLMKGLRTSPLIKIRGNKEKPNGRQIRNIVTYARALAKHDKEPLALRHLTAVAETTSAFTESMKDTTNRIRMKNEVDWDSR